MGSSGGVPVDGSSVPVNSIGNIYRSTNAVYQTAVYQTAEGTDQAAAVATQGDMGSSGGVPVDGSSVPVNSIGNIYRSTNAVYQTAVYQGAVYQGAEGADAKTDIERLVDALETVGNLEEFSQVAGGREIRIVEDAIAGSGPDQPRRHQLTQWLTELQSSAFDLQPSTEPKAQEAVCYPPLESYCEGEQVWAFFPQTQDKWLKGTVEWVRGNMVRVVSGFFGMHIERPELIAPGNWVLEPL
jgi:hypothetical protein